MFDTFDGWHVLFLRKEMEGCCIRADHDAGGRAVDIDVGCEFRIDALFTKKQLLDLDIDWIDALVDAGAQPVVWCNSCAVLCAIFYEKQAVY